jgi:histone-lysine N-methyltransferase SETMAR
MLGVKWSRERNERRSVRHLDKARPHTATVRRAVCGDNFLRIASHLPYSPDLAPSDVFLFQRLKNLRQGQQFGSAYEILSVVRKILDEISLGTLEAVSREWINRSDRCIAANGKYVE